MEHIKIYSDLEVIYDGIKDFEDYESVGLKVQLNLFNSRQVYREYATNSDNGIQKHKSIIKGVHFIQVTIEGVLHNKAIYELA